MANIFSIPFEFGPDGKAVTVDQYSDEGIAQQIGVLILTEVGERSMAPGFGVPDPTWSSLDVVDINAGLAEYGPPARVTKIAAEWLNDHTERLVLEFER